MPKKVPSSKSESKLQKLYFRTYIQMIHDSVGTNMFRHLYAKGKLDLKEVDALDDGYNSCAYYVSSILKLFGKATDFHATVARTVEDLIDSGWVVTKRPKAGDVVVWEAQKFDDGWHKHIGFCIGNGRAISNSWTERVPIEHDLYFDGQRGAEQFLTFNSW